MVRAGVEGKRSRRVSSYSARLLRTITDKGSAITDAPRDEEHGLPPTRPDPLPATGLRRVLYVCAGLVCVGLAYLGAILPGLPTTPWVLLASYCFSRSSPRLNRWLKRSPVFGRLLRDWEEHRGIRRPVKVFAVCLVVTVVSLSVTLGPLPVRAKWVVGGLALVGIGTIVFVVPTIKSERSDTGGSRPPRG